MIGLGGGKGGSTSCSFQSSQRREAKTYDEVAVFTDGQWMNGSVSDNASPKGIELSSPNSAHPLSPSPAHTSLAHSNGKRKLVGKTSAPAKKRSLPNKKVPASLVSQTDNNVVETLSSTMTAEEVKSLFLSANISSTAYEVLIPLPDQRANKPPEGYISVYKEQIGAGLRFPLHDLVIEVCGLLNIAPSQLTPNAHRQIVGFILCAKLYKIPVTADYFLSLFVVHPFPVKGIFYFYPRKKHYFLIDMPSPVHPWKTKFFFLRSVRKPWNCLTKWSETFSRPAFNEDLAKSAVEKGIMKHQFRITKLIDKKILVHGGIEPGIASPQLTFRYLMHEAAVTKFPLLPEDSPPACKTTGARESPYKAPLSAPAPSSSLSPAARSISKSRIAPPNVASMQNTGSPINQTTPTASAPASQPHANHHQAPSSSRQNGIPSLTTKPVCEKVSASSKHGIPQKELFCKGKEDQIGKSFESPLTSHAMVPVIDELQDHFVAISQTLESMFVPKECYQKLEMERQELRSEIEYMKSRVQELEQELELSEDKRVQSENRASWAVESSRSLEKTVQNLKSGSDQFHDKIRKDAINSFKSSEEFQDIQEKISKDAIIAFKSSDAFLTTVQEEAFPYYTTGFETCRLQFLNLGKLPVGFNTDFLDVSADEWGNHPEQ